MTTDSSAIGVQTIARSYFWPLPYSVRTNSTNGQWMVNAVATLGSYNKGMLTLVSLSQSSFTADSSPINAVNFSSTCADEALSVAAMRISNPDRAAWIAKIGR